MDAKKLGIAVIGAGRIGTRRAMMVKNHPARQFLAVSDRDLSRARDLADKTGAQFYSSDNL